MVDVKQQRIFSVDQVVVPPELPIILKEFSKDVIMSNPQNIIEFSKMYFEKKWLEMGGGEKKEKKDKKDDKDDDKKDKKDKKKQIEDLEDKVKGLEDQVDKVTKERNLLA